MALRGLAEGRDFREGLGSAKGNRTPIARMKILSTNRYTMAPGAKKRAKVLLFFELCKLLHIFYAFFVILPDDDYISGSTRIRPQNSQTMIFLRVRISN